MPEVIAQLARIADALEYIVSAVKKENEYSEELLNRKEEVIKY